YLMRIVLGIIFLLVALLAVVSVIRQLKIKNYLALGFSAVTALALGFFSIMTIICQLVPIAGVCVQLSIEAAIRRHLLYPKAWSSSCVNICFIISKIDETK